MYQEESHHLKIRWLIKLTSETTRIQYEINAEVYTVHCDRNIIL